MDPNRYLKKMFECKERNKEKLRHSFKKVFTTPYKLKDVMKRFQNLLDQQSMTNEQEMLRERKQKEGDKSDNDSDDSEN